MKDPNFMRTVVLICKHEKEFGSFGFVLSHGIEFSVNELVEDMDNITLPVFDGGPVGKTSLHFLHQYPNLIPESVEILKDVYWGGDFEVLKDLLRNNEIDTKKIKFFVGYSGWDDNQLQGELEEGSWIVLPATPHLIFDTTATNVWKESLKAMGGDYKQMIHFPTDPQLN